MSKSQATLRRDARVLRLSAGRLPPTARKLAKELVRIAQDMDDEADGQPE